MTKGFGKSTNKNYLSVEKQVRALTMQLTTETDKLPVFLTTPDRKKVLSNVANNLAQELKDIHFQVVNFETPGLLVVPHKFNKKGMSYTWVEQSKITQKWLVMASPPGAWDIRCLCVWKNKSKANEQAKSLFNKVRKMPLDYWNDRRADYKTMIKSIPPDDDAIVGGIDPVTGETTVFSEEVQEATRKILSLVRSGEMDIQNGLEEALLYTPLL